MDDADGVRLGERGAGLDHPRGDLRDGQAAVVAQAIGEIDAVEVLHHEIRLAGLETTDVVHAAHVLALHLRRGAGLALEARDRVLVALAEEELDRDALVELEVPRGDDDAHSTAPEDALDAILPRERLAGKDGGSVERHGLTA
jgi:hypothetical protein